MPKIRYSAMSETTSVHRKAYRRSVFNTANLKITFQANKNHSFFLYGHVIIYIFIDNGTLKY